MSNKCVFSKCPFPKNCVKDCKCPNSEEVKLAGILANNYKLKRFKKQLKKNGFYNFEIVYSEKGISTIRVATHSNKLAELQKVCSNIEAYFSNKKN